MPAGNVLEMFDERIAHGCATEGADDGEGLRGNLLRDYQSEACSDLGDELQQDGRTLLEDAAFGDEPGGFGHRLGEHASNGEVTALRCVRRYRSPAQREDLDAGQRSFRIGKVLTLRSA